jgi:hypothetical protein
MVAVCLETHVTFHSENVRITTYVSKLIEDEMEFGLDVLCFGTQTVEMLFSAFIFLLTLFRQQVMKASSQYFYHLRKIKVIINLRLK